VLSTPEPVEAVAARGHGLLEGPRWEPDGSVLYSDVTGGGVHRLRPGGEVEEVVPKRRGVGGLLPHRDGGVVASGRTLIHAREGDGEVRQLLAIAGVTGFNDLYADAEGRVFAGALRFNPLQREDPVPGEVRRVDAAGADVIVGLGVTWPNGIGLSPDGGRLYVSDYSDGRVLTYDLASGSTAPETFATAPSGSADGLAVDEDGGVWFALGEAAGVARFLPDGTLDTVVDVPGADFISSLSFGGEDRRDVVITGWRGLFRARSEVPGLAPPQAAV
jgi:sugar lactone lactonase YvrE